MSEHQNPFADRGAASKRAAAKRHRWIAAGTLGATVVGAFAWLTSAILILAAATARLLMDAVEGATGRRQKGGGRPLVEA